jgi:hypothetical protein
VLASPGTGKTGWVDAGPIGGGVRDLPPAFNVGILDFSRLLGAAVQGNLPARVLPATEKPVTSDGDNKPLKGVVVTPSAAGAPPVQLYVEEGTNLLRRVSLDAPAGLAGAGGGSLVILLGDYKNVENGLRLPGSVRLLANGVDTIGFTFDTFAVNQPVDDTCSSGPLPSPSLANNGFGDTKTGSADCGRPCFVGEARYWNGRRAAVRSGAASSSRIWRSNRSEQRPALFCGLHGKQSDRRKGPRDRRSVCALPEGAGCAACRKLPFPGETEFHRRVRQSGAGADSSSPIAMKFCMRHKSAKQVRAASARRSWSRFS